MRILMINKYHHIVGGADRYYFLLSKILTEHGHEVIPFSTKHRNNFPSPYEEFFVDSYLTRQNYLSAGLQAQMHAFFDGIYNWQASKKIEALIEATRPDVAHLHNIFYQLSPSILDPLKRRSVPVVQTLHDYQLACANNKFLANGQICEACKDSLVSILRRHCYNNNLKTSVLAFTAKVVHRTFKLYEDRVDHFIAPSRFLRDKLIEHGVPAPKITYIPYAIGGQNKHVAGSPEAGNIVLYMGRVSRHKGIYTLVEAMAPLKSLRLLIAGAGDAVADIQRLIRERQLPHIEVLNFLHDDALSLALAQASVVVVPSEWYDNSPLVIYEAFVAGKPVLGARIGGIPELVTPEVGDLFEPGNVLELRHKIMNLLSQPERLRQMGSTAQQKVGRRFSAAKHYKRIMNLYDKLLSVKRSGVQRLKNRRRASYAASLHAERSFDYGP